MFTKFTATLIGAATLTATAFAQAAEPASPGASMLSTLLLPIGMIAIFYLLLIRPQQRRAKMHQQMIENVKRGDTVVTQGGLVAKVTKIGETELTIELADGVRVRLVKGMIVDVRGKGAPTPANDAKPS